MNRFNQINCVRVQSASELVNYGSAPRPVEVPDGRERRYKVLASVYQDRFSKSSGARPLMSRDFLLSDVPLEVLTDSLKMMYGDDCVICFDIEFTDVY